jgi:hypothetical protein
MKTTMMFRSIANPRRTTLANLTDADVLPSEGSERSEGEAWGQEADEKRHELPTSTANPRRTTIMDLPVE